MCDTIVAKPQVTSKGVMIFGKNSDRHPNEAHYLEMIPAADHARGSQVKCTYIEIPQIEHTYRVLLAKPFWIWGAEMGVNEHSVVIGNEAIFSKISAIKEPKLLGMDLLRLALERSKTAKDALDTITSLLQMYGQGGNCEYEGHMYYHNSFIIADPQNAWVLETVDRNWAARQVGDMYSISNGLTIENKWDLCSDDLVKNAIQRGWCKSEVDFSFKKCYSDFLYTTFSGSGSRRKKTMDILNDNKGKIDPTTVISALRDHGEWGGDDYRPDQGIFRQTVCAHANFGPTRVSQSTGSLVAYLDPQNPTIFVTGTSAPCTSIFKPIWMDTNIPDIGPVPSNSYNAETLFWKHELLHRVTLQDYPARIQSYNQERDRLETEFVKNSLDISSRDKSERQAYSESCFQQAIQAEQDWLAKIHKTGQKPRQTWFHRLAWGSVNKMANLPEEYWE